MRGVGHDCVDYAYRMGAGRTSSSQARKATSPKAQQAAAPTSPKAQQAVAPIAPISIPGLPELKFSNKFSAFPIPEVKNRDYYINEEYLTNRRQYNACQYSWVYRSEILRAASPYIPDIFYEKSQLPYAERMAFLNSPEKQAITKALKERFETNVGATTFWKLPMMRHILELCDEVLIYGRPVVSLATETESIRKAVDLCGMTQLGKRMDIRKAKNREYKILTPDGYDAKEARYQLRYMDRLQHTYGMIAYNRAIGILPDKSISSAAYYYSKADFAHLTPKQRDELLKIFEGMPPKVREAVILSSDQLYQIYQEIKADKTGYRYVQREHPYLSREKAAQVQKVCLEMVIYRRPLALLRAENYSLERIMYTCEFHYAETFYKRQQKGEKLIKGLNEKVLAKANLQAKALIYLGKKYNHPDWVEFGQEMYGDNQRRAVKVQKHDDSQLIQNQVAQKSDYPREDGKETKATDSSAQPKAQSSTH